MSEPESELADADALHARFFDRWSKPADRERRGSTATRPDLQNVPAFRGANAADLCPLTETMRQSVLDQVARMLAAARSDWRATVAPHDVLSRDGLAAIDAAFDESAVAELVATSDPADVANAYVVTVCELGVVIGEALRAARPTLQWVPDWPYWESSLVDRASGDVIPPFHWAIRRLSATGFREDVALVDKVGLALQVLAKRATAASESRAGS
jgi:hypothetical protein